MEAAIAEVARLEAEESSNRSARLDAVAAASSQQSPIASEPTAGVVFAAVLSSPTDVTAAPAALSGPTPAPSEFVAVFGDGALGISLSDVRVVKDAPAAGQASRLGVHVGDTLRHVGDIDVPSLGYPAIIALVKASPRPLRRVFMRAAPEALASGSPPPPPPVVPDNVPSDALSPEVDALFARLTQGLPAPSRPAARLQSADTATAAAAVRADLDALCGRSSGREASGAARFTVFESAALLTGSPRVFNIGSPLAEAELRQGVAELSTLMDAMLRMRRVLRVPTQ